MFCNYLPRFSSRKHRLVRGFGLVELLVSISIIVLVSSIILTRQSAFNGAVLLRNQAYEVAFSLRQAQLLAVSGREDSGVTERQQYGVYFNTVNKNSYIVFHDKNGNGIYDATADAQVGPIGRIDPRFEIRDITDLSGVSVGNNISITFKRPNFDALFSSGTGEVYIDIAKSGVSANGTGDVRRIEVNSAGQISVVTY